MSLPNGSPVKLAIFASGAGSNAARIISYFKNHPSVEVALIVTNRPTAGVVTIADNEGIPVWKIKKEDFTHSAELVTRLQAEEIDWIILAGFLWKIPAELIHAYPKHIINIHPALLPNFGGAGMYGRHVHESVIANGETETGISIHYVDELYDHGEVIFQARCPVLPGDTPESLAERIHELEHMHFPRVIGEVITGR